MAKERSMLNSGFYPAKGLAKKALRIIKRVILLSQKELSMSGAEFVFNYKDGKSDWSYVLQMNILFTQCMGIHV